MQLDLSCLNGNQIIKTHNLGTVAATALTYCVSLDVNKKSSTFIISLSDVAPENERIQR